MIRYPLDQHIQRGFIFAALGNDQVCLALAGFHKLLVHGLYSGEILRHHAVQCAAAIPHIPQNAAQNTHIGIGVHIHL